MNMFDEARALEGTMKMVGLTQEELAQRLGVSQSYVANKLRLLRLPTDIQNEIVARSLSERHARTLLRLCETELLHDVLMRVAEDGLTVSETEQLVDAVMQTQSNAPLHTLSEQLSHILAVYSRMLYAAKITRTTEEEDGRVRLTFLIEPVDKSQKESLFCK